MKHIVFRSETRPFSAPVVVGPGENPAAHGNCTLTEYCRCGARRLVNVNGRHVEAGAWDLPHRRPNIAACATTAEDCRRYLETVTRSQHGREVLRDLCGDGADGIIRAPRRGDDKSTFQIARLVHARMA